MCFSAFSTAIPVHWSRYGSKFIQGSAKSGGGGHRMVHTNAKSGLKHKGTEILALFAEKLYKYLGIKVGVDRNRERKQLYEECTM